MEHKTISINIDFDKIFTLDEKLILYKVGHLSKAKSNCIEKVCSIIKST